MGISGWDVASSLAQHWFWGAELSPCPWAAVPVRVCLREQLCLPPDAH